MSVYLFTKLFHLLLFLLMCGTLLCGQVCADSGPLSPTFEKTVEHFKKTEKEDISGAQEPSKPEVEKRVDVKDYHSPVLVSTNNVLVALAGVNRTNKKSKLITVLTKHIGIESGNSWGNDVIANTGNNKWKTQFAVYDECKNSDCVTDDSVVRGLAAAVKGDKIYIFLANVTTKAENSLPNNELKWRFWLLVNDADTKAADKPIKWEKGETKLEFTGTEQNKDIFKKELSKPYLLDSSAFVTEEKKILFIVKSKLKDESTTGGGSNNEKNITVFFQYEENGQNKLKLLHVESTAGLHSYFFQWEGKIFKTPTDDSTKGGNSVMEFNAGEGETFKQSNSSIACLGVFLKDKQDFVNATFKEKDVLLFAQQKIATHENKVDLWMTDGIRVSNVRTIIPKIKGTFYGSLVHIKDELFVLYQNYQETDEQDSNKKILFTRLKEELGSIKNILDAWKENDEIIKEGCKDANKQNGSCAPPLPIAGLVGFLNNTANENLDIWKDEYHYRNATVKKENSQKVEKGFTFSGEGAGARWPVGEQSQDQPYNFKDPGFTLVATVKIDNGSTSGKDNSILGVGLTGGNRNAVGLWCTNDKWAVGVEKNGPLKKSEKECKQGTTYNVALVWDKTKNLEIYVNGIKTTFLGNAIKIKNNEKITHFYFGADTDRQESPTDESYVTVTRVFLYNQPFEDTDINKLRKYLKPVEVTKSTGNNTNTTGSGTDPQTPTQPPDPTKEAKDDETPSPSRTEDGGVGGGVRVFSLLLAVLCVSAPLLHL